MTPDIDVLMITYNRPQYTQISLGRLLETCNEGMRIWVWHNGTDQETLNVVKGFKEHRNFYRLHHSPENKMLTEPTNWFWRESKGDFLAKVDDDCLMPYGWAETLVAAHQNNPELGVLGCWRFPEEDFLPEYANKKILQFKGDHQLMLNAWVEGSGYLMKRDCIEFLGTLKNGQSFTAYCIELAKQGFINGWYYPFLFQEHFDDPRSSYSLIKTDADINKWAPLSAQRNGVTTVIEWENQFRRSAAINQKTPFEIKYLKGWRSAIHRIRNRLRIIIGSKSQW